MILLLFPVLVSSLVAPIVFWHGLGDSCCDGISNLTLEMKTWYPKLFTYSIQIGDTLDQDRKSSFFGQINNQVELVCNSLKLVKELKDGFNAIGFSQGGLFLRAYVQRCNDPPVLNLLTFGSPHSGTQYLQGVANIKCNQDNLNCQVMKSIIKQGVYWPIVQNKVVPAQYYKNMANLQKYLENSIFLPDINNEIGNINYNYSANINKLESIILVQFNNDHVLDPKESAHFGYYNTNGVVVGLKDQEWFNRNRLGLKTMLDTNRLKFVELEGKHMEFTLEEFKNIVDEYLQPSLLSINKAPVGGEFGLRD